MRLSKNEAENDNPYKKENLLIVIGRALITAVVAIVTVVVTVIFSSGGNKRNKA